MSFSWRNNALTKTDRKKSTRTDRRTIDSDCLMPLPILKARFSTPPATYSNPTHNVFSSYDEQDLNNQQTLKKEILQKGMTIMQLAISEPQNRTSLALYTIALNKFASARPETEIPDQKEQFWSSLLKSELHEELGPTFHKNHQSGEQNIWSQLLLVLLDLSILMMLLVQKTPLPGVLSNAAMFLYQYMVYLDTKFKLVHFACQKLAQFLYWMIDLCQHYELPRFIAQIIYLFTMTIIPSGDSCMEAD